MVVARVQLRFWPGQGKLVAWQPSRLAWKRTGKKLSCALTAAAGNLVLAETLAVGILARK